LGPQKIAEFSLRPAILRHDPGLAASPGVRYMLKVRTQIPIHHRSVPTGFFADDMNMLLLQRDALRSGQA
jgi:hypothetical protein